MAIQIEILSLTPDQATLALYYVVNNPIILAADPLREPTGSRLSGTEVTSLKNGTLIEVLKTMSIKGMTKTEARVRIEASWVEREAEAQRGYQVSFRDADLIGKAFDGTSWS